MEVTISESEEVTLESILFDSRIFNNREKLSSTFRKSPMRESNKYFVEKNVFAQ